MGLPHLDDILKAEKVIPEDTHISALDAQLSRQQNELAHLRQTADNIMLTGEDHAKKTDNLHDEALDNAQKVMELGFNMDPARAPRMFEVATGLYKLALDAVNSKRDAQLKAEKLMLDRQKLDMERRMAGEDVADANTIEAKAFVVEDRNELIKRMRADAKAEAMAESDARAAAKAAEKKSGE